MPLPTPIRGQDILPWATAVTDICRRVGGVGASRLLVREGPGGVGFDALPENKRDKAAAGTAALPWTFSCVEKEDEETGEKTREGGWTNCRLQIGYDTRWASPDLDHNSSYTIGGTSLTDDGYHYLEVTVGERDTAEIKVGRVVPATDPVAGKVRIFLAEINNAKVIGFQPHLNPVVYKYV